jgi:hypothetical protein
MSKKKDIGLHVHAALKGNKTIKNTNVLENWILSRYLVWKWQVLKMGKNVLWKSDERILVIEGCY